MSRDFKSQILESPISNRNNSIGNSKIGDFRVVIFVGHLILFLVLAFPAFAQETRTEQLEQAKTAKAAMLHPEERERGDVIVTKLEHIFMPEPPAITPTAGDFRQGAGFPFGVAFTMPAMRTGLWRTEAAYSVNNFKQGHTMLQFPQLAAGHLSIVADAKWNDAPDLDFFGVSNFSSRQSDTRYGLRSAEAGLQIDAYTYRWLRFGTGASFIGTHSDKKRGTAFVDEPNLPGAGARVDLIDARASAAIDTRESPGYTRRGGFYGATFHRYQDPDGRYSFNRTELDARQFFPILHENWVLALQGRADVTKTTGDQAVPYFMLPYVGGR
jgi:hypothetical protein